MTRPDPTPPAPNPARAEATPTVDRYAVTQRIMIPTVMHHDTRPRWPITDALLGMWAHPHSPRHRQWAYFAARRARARGVEIFDGRAG